MSNFKKIQIYPSLKQFINWSKKYSQVPIIVLFTLEEFDPYPAFFSLCKNFNKTFFLDSFNVSTSGSFSYFPLAQSKKSWIGFGKKNSLKVWKSLQNYIRSNPGPHLPKQFPAFYGGVVGLISYDLGRAFESGWASDSPKDELKIPWIDFNFYERIACYDHKKKRMYFMSCLNLKNRSVFPANLYIKEKEKLLEFLRIFKKKQSSFPDAPLEKDLKIFKKKLPIEDKKKYFVNSVLKLKKYIRMGDIYQANLSQRIKIPFKGDLGFFYARLRKINPSPYACFFRLPNFQLASCSPELLLKKRANQLETRPIAGTRPRGENSKKDKLLAGELILSPKERAEHIMLLDLERNDLGRVCESGSVKVKEKMVIEKYSHVMHIVSHVQGNLSKSQDIFSAIQAVFPGGTITGCPKIRCMQILDEIEPLARSLFFGSCGWIGVQGDGEINLLIRTAIKSKGMLNIQVGSGIVADSDPELEFQESLHKAQALLEAL
ncbi:MAG: anthranilate synthase component I family protein [Elusimicrobia bacterium]|nr:anthranilate synthase component I family protein [Elusimicrobiota bacterium]